MIYLNFNNCSRMKASILSWRFTIERLTACQLDVVLSLVDEEGNASAGRLYVRITQDSMSAVANDVMEQAHSTKFPGPLDSHVFNVLSDQQSLVTSFEAVLKLIKPLVKIGDEIAKVCLLVFSCTG